MSLPQNILIIKWIFICILWFNLTAFNYISIYDYNVKQWTAANGLSSQSIRSIVQDKQGYIWVGSLYGLNRFDGTRFTSFNTHSTVNLLSNSINKLFIDSTGYIWIGTKGGLSGVNPKTLNFSKYHILGEVTDIVEGKPGEVWVAAEGLYHIENHVINKIQEVKGSVYELASSPAGVWVLNENKLILIDKNIRITTITLPSYLHKVPIHTMRYSFDTLYIGTDIGAFYIDHNYQIKKVNLPDNKEYPIYSILFDKNNGLWLSSQSVLFYQIKGFEWQQIQAKDLGHPPWFAELFEDRKNNIWLGSFSDGLWRFSRSELLRHAPKSMPDYAIRTLHVGSNQKLWVATQNGVGYLDNNQFKEVISGEVLGKKEIYQLIEMPPNNILLGTNDGVITYNNKKGTIKYSEQFKNSIVRVLQKSNLGHLWIGSDQGLFLYKNNSVTAFKYNHIFESSHITYIEENEGRLWIGTTRGVYLIKNDQIERVGIGSNLYRTYVTTILDLTGRGILVSTLDDGIFYQNKSGFWEEYNESNGLLSGGIAAIHYEYARDQVWVSTLKGIYRFQLKQLALPNIDQIMVNAILGPYNKQLGSIAGRCCNGLGHGKIIFHQGSFWFPTLKGIVEVPATINTEQKFNFKPIIESVITPAETLYPGYQQELELKMLDRELTIYYSIINYTLSQNIEFRYQLEGLDSTWRHVKQLKQAVYTNLPPGDFIFKVQAKYETDPWELGQESTININVPYKFTETYLYQGLLSVMILVLINLLSLVINQSEKNKNKVLHVTLQEKEKQITLLNTDISTLNTKLQQVSHKDELSGLRNRQFLFEQLPKDIEHFQRNRETTIAHNKSIMLAVIDIGNLKTVNKNYGPVAGDSILAQFADLLTQESRVSDYVVRWGGDEFLIVFRDVLTQQVEDQIESLVQTISQKKMILPDGKHILVNCSVGYSLFPLDLIGGQLISWDISLSLAEMALHRVKHEGNNCMATLKFDTQVDAFEFEDSDSVAILVEDLLATESARFEVKKIN